MEMSLEEVFEFIRNGASIKQFNGSGVPITRIETIATGNIDLNKVGYADIFDSKYESYYLKDGDILMSHINSLKHLGKVAIVESLEENVIHGMNLLCLRPKKMVCPKFLLNYFRTQQFNAEILRISKKSVNQASFNITDLKKIKINLPNLEIQNKIANTLELASELIEKRKEQIAEMDKLIQSVFYEIFGDPNKLSKEWKVNLKEVANITTGNTPSRKELENYGNHMEWIKTDNMTFDSLYPSRAAEYLSEIGVNKARIADKESILMTCIAGSKKSIGKVVLLDRAVAFNQQINAITVNGNIHVKYLFYILKFSKVRLEDFANDSMKKMITKSKLETFEINNVDMKRQLEFTSIVEEIESQKKVMEESLHEMENNFNALMQKAFRGDLFPEE